MQESIEEPDPIATPSAGGRGMKLLGGAVVLVLAASAFFPLFVVFVGVVLVALVALDSAIPHVIPGLRTLFRVPLVPASARRARLIFAGSLGVVLVAIGALGAKMSGEVRTEWKLRQSQHRIADEQLDEHLARARSHLDAGEVELAELTLMDAQRISPVDARRQRELDGLLERIRRSGDADTIRAILQQLPPDELDAFERGESVPEALEFPERALTYRAVQLARAQTEQARETR
jgi:hypothetical protein